MSKEMSVIVLGVWVAIVPYLGIPGTWRTAILLLTGIALAIIGFLLRGESLNRMSSRNTFVEHGAEPERHENQGITSLN